MTQLSNPFTDEPQDTREEILRATFDILTEVGYSETSISRIADRVGISKSVVYHYYDDREALLLEVLEAVLEQLLEMTLGDPERGPRAELEHFLTVFIPEKRSDDPTAQSYSRLGKTYMNLRAQAISDPTYQEKFADSEARVKTRLTETIREGIERGEFQQVDPERTSEHLLTFVAGIIFREATTGSVSTELLRQEVEEMLSERIYR